MKTQIVFLIVALLMITSLKAQVKIGDNPQNLDPASVLELESNNRVLVITRVTTAQMSTINPLRGALVYNTDEECIHYYNGVEWINICEALDNSFTVSSEAVFNTLPDARDSTIVVTQTETPDGINYNFEVNQITGDNIYNGTLFGSDFASGAIGSREIQDSAVELKKLEDGTIAGQLIQWDGNSWELITDTDLNITEGDGEIGNEVVGPTDTTLILDGNGSEIEPYTLDVSPMGIGTPELADNAVTTDKILNGNITDDKLDKTNIPLSGFGAANADVDLGLNKLTNVGEPTVATDAATMNYVDNAIGTVSTLNNGQIFVGDATNNAIGVNMSGDATIDNAGALTIEDNAITNAKMADNAINTAEIVNNSITTVKILDANVTNAKIADNAITNTKMADNSVNTLEIIDNAVTTPKIANDAITTVKILDANVTNAKIADDAVDVDKIGTLGAADANSVLTTDGLGDPQWEDKNIFASSTLSNGDIFVGDAANSAVGVTMNGDATINNTGLLTIENDAITTVKIANDAITTGKIAAGAVESSDIAIDAVDVTRIGTAGAADANSVLTTDGLGDPQWENKNIFASSTLSNGDIFVGDATNNAIGVTMGGDATINSLGELTIANDAITNAMMTDDAIDTNEIVDDAVTTNKILDANVTTDKIADGDVTPLKIEPSPSLTDGDVLTTVGGAVVWKAPAVVAMGKVNFDGSPANITGAAVIRNGAGSGNYTVTFGAGVTSDADYIVQLTLLNAGPDVTIEVSGTPTATAFTVQISDIGGTPTDAQWYFTVTDF
ncbi:hypothetical protein [Allomuricauda sp. CP2A]|uniref:hypothetical protein n=1 Tax=Allomuricauda sp. CP2A TaxID=1848189 RepID=UPI000AAB0172|nr:hypothetical protein [Muricauda sp. CP2A]